MAGGDEIEDQRVGVEMADVESPLEHVGDP